MIQLADHKTSFREFIKREVRVNRREIRALRFALRLIMAAIVIWLVWFCGTVGWIIWGRYD